MIDTAVILAGGFGTRLQSVVKDVPKPMADISRKPFLEYLLQYLLSQRIQKAILSVGYKWDTIKNYFGESYKGLTLEYSVEEEPLGTGGAILKSVESSNEDELFIFNGDTFFNIDLAEFYSLHKSHRTKLSIALKSMKNFDRYGVVQTDADQSILSFEEKKFYEEGNINGGIYILNRALFASLNLPTKFSFEKEVMEKYCSTIPFTGFPFNDYFIDIGIPEDYQRAQVELPELLSNSSNKKPPLKIDRSWTLFLDRDGVINKKIDDDYVRNLKQFEWLNGVEESLISLSKLFGRIIIVTNQQGIGKGLMTTKDVENIHSHIQKTISDKGGRIDQIYFAPQLKVENSPMRKPGIGMALEAKKDFPEIDFSKSIMVGDSMSDIQFGAIAGMKTVFITHGNSLQGNEAIDLHFNDLKSFTDFVLKAI